MKLSHLFSLTTATVGMAALTRTLLQRHQWEQANNRVAICVDFADAQEAAIRAGCPLKELLEKLAANGATHLSLPEWRLLDLLQSGALTPQAPAVPRIGVPPVGHWNYLHGEAGLVVQLAAALQKRLPQTAAVVLEESTLSFAGSLPAIGQLGLGFDRALAALIQETGLDVVPQPVSYDWPDPELLAQTLAEAAALGRLVAFAGDMILGHEMHLDATVDALRTHGLKFVYFAQSRHQKGDWFIAKRRAPEIILGHQFSPAEMVPLDYHAACHNWAHFARERGIRFCYVNFFKALHATAPLEGIDYVHHLKHALEDSGFVVTNKLDFPQATNGGMPAPAELAAAGIISGSVAATAVTSILNLPESLAIPLQLSASAGAAALPFLEAARNLAATALYEQQGHDEHHHEDGQHHHEHEHDHDHDHGSLHALYPPSYAPKLIALTSTALGPITAAQFPLAGSIFHLANMTALAAVTSGQEYQLRIETYRGFNLDWLIPLTAAAWQLPDRSARLGITAALGAGWLAARRFDDDLLARLDPGHAEGHTHHISAAMAALGDLQMALGPKPARKWSGLGSLLGGASALLGRNGHGNIAAITRLLAIAGYTLGLVSLRHPERSLAETLPWAAPSLGAGTLGGVLLALLPPRK